MNFNKSDLTAEKLAAMVDHTLLKPFACNRDFKKLCDESVKYGFKSVIVNGGAVKTCKKYLESSTILVGSVVGFPLGQATMETKLFETKDAIQNGADEIDYVVNIAELKNRNLGYVENEMSQIVEECKRFNVISKVIFETCYLTEEEKILLCGIALKVNPDFIKTSTGYGEWGAKVEDVMLMKEQVKNKIKVKASGGIRDLKTALEMVSAGAERIGTSAGVRIVEE